MKTLSFIGSDKNAGKTTVFYFMSGKLYKNSEYCPICLTSIGINGEDVDAYEGKPKPKIVIKPDMFFVTAGRHLTKLAGCYETVLIFQGISQNYVMGKSLSYFPLVLEGPNTGSEISALKTSIINHTNVKSLLIDGSIDRQFLARPAISDEFYFALLISNRNPQIQKASDLMFSLLLPVCDHDEITLIENNRNNTTRSLIFDTTTSLLHRSAAIPSLDEQLKQICWNNKGQPIILYLNGALSGTLFDFLSPLKNIRIILDNFSLYQHISVKKNERRPFLPQLCLLYPVHASKIFIKLDNVMHNTLPVMPANIPVYNLFRDLPHEIII